MRVCGFVSDFFLISYKIVLPKAYTFDKTCSLVKGRLITALYENQVASIHSKSMINMEAAAVTKFL